jgi:hypothetical protein
MALEPDRDQLEIFLDAVLRHRGDQGYLSMRVFQHDNKPIFSQLWTARLGPKTGSRHALDIAVDLARRAANTPQPAVFCPPIAVFNNADGFHAGEADLFKGLAISVECDQRPEEARQKLQEILGEATAVVRSGGQWVNGDDEPEDKLHLHYRLKTPATGADLTKLKQARRIAAALVGGDASNIPAVHCLRWPGSWHRKAGPRLCELVSCNPDVEIDLDEALAALEQAAPGRKKTGNGGTGEAADEAELIGNILAGVRLHDSINRLAAKWVRGKGPEVINSTIVRLQELMERSKARLERYDDWKARYDDIGRGVESAWVKFRDTKPPEPEPSKELPAGVTLEDFYAYMPQHLYIYVPTRELWPAASLNGRLPKVGVLKPTTWLDRNKPVEQMTWAPGEPMLIPDRLVREGGWFEHAGVTCFNLYKPPTIASGDPNKAGQWIDHVRKVYPEEADQIIRWCAQRVQHPEIKINHALVLGGDMGIGKDTLLEPVKRAVGSWNCHEVSPQHMMGRFNGFLKSVILRVSEARDLGELNRYQFYDHMKAYTAAPPDVLRIDEKNIPEYSVPNCCGVVITTNHKTDGIYLPPHGRRHFVAWSPLSKEDFGPDYWNRLWRWYDAGGYAHVANYLKTLDLTDFDPKAPPPKTRAFWDIVDASRAPEDADLADVLDNMGRPDVVTLISIVARASDRFRCWLEDPKNSRAIPHRLQECGYVKVRNPDAEDGLWRIAGKRQAIYARADLSLRDQLAAAARLAGRQ